MWGTYAILRAREAPLVLLGAREEFGPWGHLCRFCTLNRADLHMSDIPRAINRKCLTQLRARDNVTAGWPTRGRTSNDFRGTIVGETRLG